MFDNPAIHRSIYIYMYIWEDLRGGGGGGGHNFFSILPLKLRQWILWAKPTDFDVQ